MGTMNVSRRDLLKFGGIGALGLAGATALAGCAPQAAGDAGKGDAAGDGSTYEGWALYVDDMVKCDDGVWRIKTLRLTYRKILGKLRTMGV